MLKKLRMPKPKALPTDELDAEEMPESSEMEAAEFAEEEEAEEEEKEEEYAGELSKVSDEELLAEVKKRGLMSQLEEETGEESAQDAYV